MYVENPKKFAKNKKQNKNTPQNQNNPTPKLWTNKWISKVIEHKINKQKNVFL